MWQMREGPTSLEKVMRRYDESEKFYSDFYMNYWKRHCFP